MTTPIIGTFTTQFSNASIQDLLATYEASGTISANVAGQFQTTAPEPNTWTALAIGLAGIGLRYRRSLKKC